MNLSQQKNNKGKFDNFIKYSSLGIEMAAIIAIGTFAGYKIDQWMGNDLKIFTLVLLIISAAISIIYGIRNLLK